MTNGVKESPEAGFCFIKYRSAKIGFTLKTYFGSVSYCLLGNFNRSLAWINHKKDNHNGEKIYREYNTGTD